MNVLILDQTGSGVDFALRCRAAGHYPRVHMAIDSDTKRPNKNGDGLIEKIKLDEWPKHMDWADIVLTTDNSRLMGQLDTYRKRNYPIFAPSPQSADLELKRDVGQKFLADHGIEVIDYEAFSDYGNAEKFVLASGSRYVSKPMGDKDKQLSYVSTSPRDMIYMLRRWNELNKQVGRFMLQEFVPGCEMAVGGWLGAKGFSGYWCENFEHKKLMVGDLGPNTGEMGTALLYTDKSELAEQVLLPLERDLIKMGHRGYIDVAVIVNEDGVPLPLEFTSRLMWPGFYIQQVLHPDPVEWMLALLDGDDIFKPLADVALGVVLTVPNFPYPALNQREVEGIPVYGLDDDNDRRELISPSDLMDGTAPDNDGGEVRALVSSGNYLCVCSGRGETVRKAQAEAYKTIDSLEVPRDLGYRIDIGDRLRADLPCLQDHGFAKNWTY